MFLLTDKSKSDHLLQTTVIWALTTIFRMYPVEVNHMLSTEIIEISLGSTIAG